MCGLQVLSQRRKLIRNIVFLVLGYDAALPSMKQGADIKLDCKRYMPMNDAYQKFNRSLTNGVPDIYLWRTEKFQDICMDNTVKRYIESDLNGDGHLFGKQPAR